MGVPEKVAVLIPAQVCRLPLAEPICLSCAGELRGQMHTLRGFHPD